MKSIYFLGGGQLGIPTLKWAREIGFHVIVNDKTPKAPGLKYADVTTSYDSTDIKKITTWAITYQAEYNIQYCYCGSDFGLLTASNVHQALGIPYHPIKAIINGLDKRLMKKCWHQADVKFPRSVTIFSASDLATAVDSIGIPMVVKPVDSSGSRGVSIVCDPKNLDTAYREAIFFAGDGSILCEEYIDGSHHDINGIFWKNIFYPCGIGDRIFTPLPYPVPHHGYFQTSLRPRLQKKLYYLLEEGARSMGVNHGPVKADCVVSNDECYVYEISPRFHGDIFTSNTLGFLHKKNPIYQLLKMIYDKSYNFRPIDPGGKIAGWKMLSSVPCGNQSPGISGKYIIKKKTKPPPNEPIKNNLEIAGFIWAVSTSRKKINECLDIYVND